jgi:hypothetical protein
MFNIVNSPVVKIGIHQPDFLPWTGFFNKYLLSDKFVFLDDAQFSKGGSDWTNRTLVSNNGNPKWITLPVGRNYSGVRLVNEIFISNPLQNKIEILRTIEGLYRNHTYFPEIYEFLKMTINLEDDSLAVYNHNLIQAIIDLLRLPTKEKFFSSKLMCEKKGNERLVEIIKKLNGNLYLSGEGGKNYIKVETMESQEIELHWINYKQPQYVQLGSLNFIPGLSILDNLMNLGIEGTKAYLERGIPKGEFK